MFYSCLFFPTTRWFSLFAFIKIFQVNSVFYVHMTCYSWVKLGGAGVKDRFKEP